MLIAGMDEVGWGAFAGPVVSVVFVASEQTLALMPSGVTDSKKMSADARQSMFQSILHAAHDFGLGYAFPREIDSMTPGVALQLSYERALKELRCTPNHLIMDGNKPVKSWKGSQLAEPKADLKYWQVSAASIIAKVFRDNLMAELHKQHPMYGWDKNSGYGTPDHIQAIQKHGLLLTGDDNAYQHRRSYCKKYYAV